MDNKEKMQIIEEILSRQMTDKEKEIACEMLAEKPKMFTGSNSPAFIARRLQMLAEASRSSK